MSQYIALQFIPASQESRPVTHLIPVEYQTVFENSEVGIVEFCGIYGGVKEALQDLMAEGDIEEWTHDCGKVIEHYGDHQQRVLYP